MAPKEEPAEIGRPISASVEDQVADLLRRRGIDRVEGRIAVQVFGRAF